MDAGESGIFEMMIKRFQKFDFNSSCVSAVPGRSGEFAQNRIVSQRMGKEPCMAYLQRFLAFLLTSLFVFLLCDLLAWQSIRSTLNWIFPLFLIFACVWTAAKLVTYNTMLLWTPVPWLLAATAVYFGMGPLAYTFGNAETVFYMDNLFPVDTVWLWRTNLLNIVGTLTIMITFLIMLKVLNVKLLTSRQSGFDIRKVKSAALFFLVVGLPIKYLFALPYEFGLLGFVLPGSLFQLTKLVLFGLLLLTYLSARKGGNWSIALVVLFSLELLVAFLRFNKSDLLLLFVVVALGQYLAKRDIRILVLWAVVGLGAYLCLCPIVSWGRVEIAKETGAHYRATLGQRFGIVWRGINSGSIGQEKILSERQVWWWRLCYTPTQAFAMDAYDAGRPGETYSLWIWTFVPRVMFSEKPVISYAGIDFSELILGHQGSSMGIGIYAEGYWNGGWFTVIAVCSYIGALFACLSKAAFAVMARSQVLFLPCVFIGMEMGYSIDHYFVSEYVGKVVIYLGYFAVVHFVFIKGLLVRKSGG